MNTLTDRQAKLHAFLCERWSDPPTVREMAAHMDSQVNSVMGHLKSLARKGYIELSDGARSRGVKLLIGPDLDGTDIEIAGRLYRLVHLEGEGHARSVTEAR